MQMIAESFEFAELPYGHSALYLYNDRTYEPLARIERSNDDPETDLIQYYQNNLNGCPEEVTNKNGEIIWSAETDILGNTTNEFLSLEDRYWDQNLRFQGQYLDRETGLHYNTFRYFDPKIGRFTQLDPIGLNGGFNLYQYASNTLTWVDPLGWCSTKLSKNLMEAQGKKASQRPPNVAAHHIIPEKGKYAVEAREILAKHNIDIDGALNGVFLPNRFNKMNTPGILHNGPHGNLYSKAVTERIKIANNSGGKEAVIKELDIMRDILLKAPRDAKWKVIIPMPKPTN